MSPESLIERFDEEMRERFGLRPDLVGTRYLADGLQELIPHLEKMDSPRFGPLFLERAEAWASIAQRGLPAQTGPITGSSRLRGDWPVHAMIVGVGRSADRSKKSHALAAQIVVASDLIQSKIDQGRVRSRSGFVSTRLLACRRHRQMTRRELDLFPNIPYCMVSLQRALDALLDGGLTQEHENIVAPMERMFAYALGLRDSPLRGPRQTTGAASTPRPIRILRCLGSQDPDGEIHETEFALINESSLSQDELDDHRRLGLSGEESELGVTLLQPKRTLRPQKGETPGLATWHSRSAIKHQQKATQRLPSRWDSLSAFEITVLLRAILESREESPGAVALLTLCLMTGQAAEDALRTRVCRDVGTLPDDIDAGVVYLVTENATWHRRVFRPTNARSAPANTRRILAPVSSRVGFPIAKHFWQALEPSLCRTLGWTDQHDGALFEGDLAGIDQAKALVALINRRQNTRLTLLRIQQTLYQLLVEHEGDLAEACLVTGQLPPTGQSASVFYHHTTTPLLVRCYTHVIRALPLEMEFFSHDELLGRGSEIGSELRLALPALRRLVSDLRESVRLAQFNWTTPDAWIEFHNAYTSYTIMLMLFTTGYRAVQDPIATEADIDWDNQLVVINDKVGERESRSRIVPLAQPCWQQLENFQRHRRFVVETLTMLDREAPPSFFFFLTHSAQAEQVRPATLARRLKHCFDLPLNLNRHLLRGYIREAGVPGEAVDAFMGHWMDGQNPWGRYSSMDPLNYRIAIGRAVERLSYVVQWRVLEGLS